MSYTDHLNRYGNPANEGQIIIREYIRRPETLADAEDIKRYDQSAAEAIEEARRMIEDLTEYRQALAARYASLEVMPYKRILRIERENYSYTGIKYRVTIAKHREDGTEVKELEEVYPGKERHIALKRFAELQKQYPGIESEKHIEKSKWER